MTNNVRDNSEVNADITLLTNKLIARYLIKHKYESTFNKFITETGLSQKMVLNEDFNEMEDRLGYHTEDLETMVSERVQFKAYKKSVATSTCSTENGSLGTVNDEQNVLNKISLPHWKYDRRPVISTDLSSKINSLVIAVFSDENFLIVSTSNRKIYIYSIDHENTAKAGNYHLLQEIKTTSVVKFIQKIDTTSDNGEKKTLFLFCELDGNITVIKNFAPDLEYKSVKLDKNIRMISTFLIFVDAENELMCLVSCLNKTVKAFQIKINESEIKCNLIRELKLLTNCSTINIVQPKKEEEEEDEEEKGKSSGDNNLLIYLTRLESTQIYVYDLKFVLKYKISLNNAQFSTHSFTVTDLIFFNTKDDNTAVAKVNNITIIKPQTKMLISTSHVPYMRLLLVEATANNLDSLSSDIPIYYNMILENFKTEIYQDSFSTNMLVWDSDCNGCLLGCDSGLYSIDLSNRCEVVPLTSNTENIKSRVKSLYYDDSNNRILVSYANKELYVLSS
ncbi:uncharacterized protein SCODWIG_01356 [Saccharomycodes ludwigii]|uniref:Uncharacterized protein n=1 Tax=Saccharomycodes ludwigii TaxID=36035 RepID=A0A376B4H6_9ASCO|nr:uncharacterized protein SCODWIG_01356 [Saccharomycodes ludwigii]